MLIKYLQVLFISMLPVIELRGAIPFATAIGVPPLTAYGISIIGNMLPIPFIFLFAGKILHWGKDKPYIGNIFTFFLDKGYKAGEKLENKAGFGLFFALTLFVGIPLPGTAAWTFSFTVIRLTSKLSRSFAEFPLKKPDKMFYIRITHSLRYHLNLHISS